MTRRIGFALLLLCFVVPHAIAAKRRAVVPGKGCVFGVLDQDAFVSALAIDGTHVYYVDDLNSTLYRIPKNGGARTRLAEFPTVFVTAMAVDDANVYLATLPVDFGATLPPGDLYAIPKSGGTPRTIANGVLFVTKLLTDATHVYWVSVGTVNLIEQEILSDGKVERVRKDGSSREVLASGLSAPLGASIDDANVYFGETGSAVGNTSMGLRRVAKSGGSVAHLSDDYSVFYLVPNGDELVFAGGSEDDGGLFRIAKTGGTAQLIASVESIEGAPHVIDGFVYYLTFPLTDETDSLMRVPVSGGTPQLVRIADSSASEFEVDGCGVYLGTNEGELVKGTR